MSSDDQPEISLIFNNIEVDFGGSRNWKCFAIQKL
jgi:hypothetical protein